MDCLKGYIGMSESVGEAESGLYLNALPGISMNSIDKIADCDQKDYEGVFKDVEQRSILKFRTLFTRELNQCFRISKRDIVECLICENRELLAVPLWYLMGAEFMLERKDSERTNKFTTVGKKGAKETYEEFMETFESELRTAVAGIDINSTPCIYHDEGEPNNIIKVIYSCP